MHPLKVDHTLDTYPSSLRLCGRLQNNFRSSLRYLHNFTSQLFLHWVFHLLLSTLHHRAEFTVVEFPCPFLVEFIESGYHLFTCQIKIKILKIFAGKTFNDYSRKRIVTTTGSSPSKSSPVKRPKSKWLSRQWTKTATAMSARKSSNGSAKVWPVNKWRPLSINSTKKGRGNSTTVNSARWCTVDSRRRKTRRRNNSRVNEIAVYPSGFFLLLSLWSIMCPRALCSARWSL